MQRQLTGDELAPAEQRKALARFTHRFTSYHVPSWASPNYAPQFLDDADWLANTRFYVTKSGRLDERHRHCESSPTWPYGKGIWGRKGIDWHEYRADMRNASTFCAYTTWKAHKALRELPDDKKQVFAINWKMAHTLFNVESKYRYLGLDPDELQAVDWHAIWKTRDLGRWSHGGKVAA